MTKAVPGPRRLALATTLILAVTAVFGQASPAVAVPAAPTDLAPSGPVSSNTPVLSWSKAPGAVKYEVQVDNNDDFSSPIFTSTTTNNRSVPDKVLPSGDISWRVRSLDASNDPSGWAVESIQVAPTNIPSPTSPIGDVLQQPNEPPLLVWDGIQGATKYTVQVDETNDFTSPVVSVDTQTTSLVVPNPLPEGEYFWRVKASKATGVDSVFSEPVSFTIVLQAPPLTTGSGHGSEDIVEDVELTWQPVAGASYYQLQVATDSDFNALVDDKSTTNAKVFGTSYSPSVTYDNNQYFWRVRGVDAAGNRMGWSETRQFIRDWPDQPVALYPLGDGSPLTHISSPPYFQWTPVQHASLYQLQLGVDPNFSPGTFDNCSVTGTTYTPGSFAINHNTGTVFERAHEYCDVIPGQLHYWRVRPLDLPFTNPGVEGLYSETQTFIWDDDAFGGFSPANGATVAVPTMSWEPIRGVEQYEVTVWNGLGQPVLFQKATYATSYTPVNIPALDASKNPFTWEVVGINADGSAGSMAYSHTFNIGGSIPTTGAAPLTPLTGVSGTTLRAPKLTWEPHPDAASYRVFAGPHGGNLFTESSQDALNVKLPYPAVTDIWTWFLTPGQYDWYVAGYSSTGSLIGVGPTATFTIGQLDAVQGQSIALNGLTLDAGQGCTYAVSDLPDTCDNVPATPVLSWEPVEGAAMYMVYVAEDNSFSQVIEPLNSLGATSNTRYFPSASSLKSALNDSNTATPYFWFIRPCKSRLVCGPSPVSVSGSATNKFRKVSPGVQLLTPANAGTVTTTDVRLDWVDYFVTNQATTWSETGEQGLQAAQSYRVQVDNDASFGSPIESVVVDQSVYTAPGRLYPEGELFWRVQAIDGEGNSLSWSPTRTFTKATAPITLQSPLNQTVNGTTAFRWAAQTSVGSYQLEVYKNNDTAATLSNKLFTTVTSKQNAYVFDKPIPASGQPYVWRVRRMDASLPSNPGPWSAWGTFHSSGSTPTLIAPADGAFQPSSGPLFTWSEVPGGTSYSIEVVNAATSVKLSGTPKSTPANAWAPTAPVANGTWKWRVTAKDANSGILGISAWRTFKVDALAPTVVAKSPLNYASVSANFKATFSEPVKGVSTSTMKLFVEGRATPLLATVTLSADKKVATLNPGANLRVGKYYTVKLSSGIRDLNDNPLASTSWKVRAR